MSRLEEIKEEFARSQNFDRWNRLKYFYKGDQEAFENVLDMINTQYATEVARASLEKASESSLFDWNTVSKNYAIEYKKSITNPENIVLL